MDAVATLTLLGFGLLLGLKHAIEADHLAAVSTIVTQRKSVWSASIVGGLWGIGHTISLFVAGLAVIFFHFEIGERAEQTLEFCVAIMLIVLGIDAIRRLIKGGQIHVHSHSHGEVVHFHPHTHGTETAHDLEKTSGHSHAVSKIGFRPVIVGMIHGLAGSGALMLLVLTTISSPMAGLLYILVFGIGSIMGMMLMSLLLGLPMYLTASRFRFMDVTLRLGAGAFSLALGVWLAASYISL
nr:nickel transporter UreH [uncultured bacterium]